MKKTLRYLLIAFAVMSVLSVSAQSLAQQPQAQMQSTSGMVYSGSTLPQAAATGAMVTGTTPGTYTPAKISSRPRRVIGNDDNDITPPGDNTDPDATPLGDVMWPLALLACAYLMMRVMRSRKRSV